MTTEIKSIKQTKRRLAILFAGVVFCIAFILEFTYLTFRFASIYKQEFEEFQRGITFFSIQIGNDDRILDLLLNGNRIFDRGRMENRIGGGGDIGPLKFIDFITLDKSGNIINGNVRRDLELNEVKLSDIKEGTITSQDGVILTKVGVNSDNVDSVVFLKKQIYPIGDYISDLIYFNFFNLLFSLFFYYIGYIFVRKNLKPVEENIKDMDDFIHNASHELKTPLSVISSNLQLIKKLKTYEEDLLNNSIEEIKIVDNLIVGLTNLSSISSTEEIEELDVKEEIKNIIEEFNQAIKEKNINVFFESEKNFSIKANKHYFYIMFSNLLRNAIKYNNEKDGKIEISVNKDIFTISNSGAGISQEDLPKIFERLFKGERARNSDGYGIGLSLVKKICDIYKWKIKATSDNEKTTFEVKF